jgi:xanthine/uracil permease
MSIKPELIVKIGNLFDKIFWNLCVLLIGIAFGYAWAWIALEETFKRSLR